MDFIFKEVSLENIEKYAKLLGEVFPTAPHLGNEAYLRWLYQDNPDGYVVGFDAFFEGELAAHYVCIPIRAKINNKVERGLLSLNTATHPSYQGKGLFTKLATQTYQLGLEKDYKFVYGVANQNSTPGFIKKLGFQLVAPLEAFFFWGKLKEKDQYEISFSRHWSQESQKWRLNPPHVKYHLTNDGVFAPTSVAMLKCAGLVDHSVSSSLIPKLFLGMNVDKSHALIFNIPEKLRPSPLNLIYKSLNDEVKELEPSRSYIQFLDFDAY